MINLFVIISYNLIYSIFSNLFNCGLRFDFNDNNFHHIQYVYTYIPFRRTVWILSFCTSIYISIHLSAYIYIECLYIGASHLAFAIQFDRVIPFHLCRPKGYIPWYMPTPRDMLGAGIPWYMNTSRNTSSLRWYLRWTCYCERSM